MPYYLYRIQPLGILHKIGEHAGFAPASAEAKRLRAELPPGSPDRIKVMFADNELAAEDQLSQPREPGPPGEE